MPIKPIEKRPSGLSNIMGGMKKIGTIMGNATGLAREGSAASGIFDLAKQAITMGSTGGAEVTGSRGANGAANLGAETNLGYGGGERSVDEGFSLTNPMARRGNKLGMGVDTNLGNSASSMSAFNRRLNMGGF